MVFSTPHPVILEDVARIVAAPLPWQEFAGATVLITGASGILPAYMVETLLFLSEHVLDRPVRILALVRNADRARQRFAAYAHRQELELLEQDVCDPLQLPEKLDYVVHAA